MLQITVGCALRTISLHEQDCLSACSEHAEEPKAQEVMLAGFKKADWFNKPLRLDTWNQ
jgi:hypothetical protein